MKENTLNKFAILPSYYEAAAKLPEHQRDRFLAAIICYGVAGEIPVFDDPVLAAMFDLVRPNIDKSVRHFQKQKENGNKGGRPKTHTQDDQKPSSNIVQNPLETQPKPSNNPTQTQVKPNKNRDSDSDSDSESESEYNSNKFELAHATGSQISLLSVENSPKTPAPKPKGDFRNVHVEQLMAWFEQTYGFPPTDKRPRQRAYNIVQAMKKFCQDSGQSPGGKQISSGLKHFCDWYASSDWHNGTQTMDAVARKFNVWRAEVEGKRKV